jgi:dynein heavy chain
MEIEQSMESYKPVAKRGAILFFALTGLSSINTMYEYSLSSYLVVFINALSTSKKDNVLQARLRFIIEKLTQLVYEFACMGIFEKHKLMFSFQMTTMIMDGENELNRDEMDFFLKGNTSLDSVTGKPFKWMNQDGWKDAVRLSEFGESWVTLLDDIRDNEKIWKKWYDTECPEEGQLPMGYSKKLNVDKDKFKPLLLIRIFRPDRVINAIKRFIIARMNGNEYYVKSPPIVYKKILQQSNEKTPIVFILSPGADPYSEVARLIEEEGIGIAKLQSLALGQGMED